MQPARRIEVEPLAVDAHARCDDQPLYRPLDQCLEEDRRTEVVHTRVLGDLVHALAHTDPRREVKDRVDPAQRPADRLRITEVAALQLDLRIEVGGTKTFVPMDPW